MRSTRLLAAVALSVTLFAPVSVFSPVAAAAQEDQGVPVLRAPAGTAMPQRYVVTVAEGTDPATVAQRYRISKADYWRDAVNGFAGELADSDLEQLRRDPAVRSISEDALTPMIQAQSQLFPPNWGLDRIDQRNPVSSSIIKEYVYNATGAGVHVYVLDTGIAVNHGEFGGRADVVWDGYAGDGGDCHGHGTHVAGIIGSASYGVAKQARLHSLRVLKCDGFGVVSTLISALDWLRTHFQRPAVANLSLRVPFVMPALNDAVTNLSNAGVFVAVAAGNDTTNACNVSPASAAGDVITVAASNDQDHQWAFSNYGTCVDLYAPGQHIDSTVLSGHAHLSGTSMASPHVAGAAAIFKQFGDAPSWVVRDWIINSSTKDRIITANQGTPNRLLFIDPYFSRAPTITPASQGPRDEYAYATVVQGLIDTASEYSSSGGRSRVYEISFGEYLVDLANLGAVQGGSNGKAGVVHVTASGNGNASCRIGGNGWGRSGLYVRVHVLCFTPGGLFTRENFSVVFSRRVSTGGPAVGYAYASDATLDAYLPPSDWSFNSAGNFNEVYRLATGRYQVIMRKLASNRGFAMVTSVADQATCSVPDWGSQGPDEYVSVSCMDRFGNAADSRFAVSFYDTSSLLSQAQFHRAAAWAGSPTTPSYDSFWSFNSRTGGLVHINRTGVGQYEVFVPAPLGTDSGSFQVTGGSSVNRCKALPHWLEEKVFVRCYNHAGALTDGPFTLHWVTTSS